MTQIPIRRQPTHDLHFTTRTESASRYTVVINLPCDFASDHLGSVNIVKVGLEAVVYLNIQEGLETPDLKEKHLFKLSLQMNEQVKKYLPISISLLKTHDFTRYHKRWQRWKFHIGKNKGEFVVCYVYV